MDIGGWLRGLGLERYEQAFRDNEIDLHVLPELTADDLKELGVTAIGHRRLLLKAISDLAADAGPVAADDSPAAPALSPTAEAERRHLTVMFCDLVGSTPLSSRFDPEDLRDILGAYHRSVASTVGRLGGFVAKYMGDGVLVYFGYPQAHEDDAERAVRAGLALVKAIAELDAGAPLQARVGVATGLVIVGDLIGEGEAQERGVVGETPNLAARLQALAAPDTVVIADATRRQLGGLFDLEDLGSRPLAGFAEPQRAWLVRGESGVISRFEALRSGETPLVGRDEELELLLRRWEQAKSGEGRVVLVSGEPGIGKSRLTAAISERLHDERHTRLRWFCSPYHQDSALYPVTVQLERGAGFRREDTPEQRLDKMRAVLVPGEPSGAEAELLSELLSLPNRAAELNLSPQRKREMLFEALLHQLAGLARAHPVLAVFEDAHWLDPTSRELLDLMVERVRRLPVLLVITFRPEFQAPWGGQPHVTVLALNRLGERDVAALVLGLAGNTPLGGDVVEEIVERTDGVPLFVEELTKAILEGADQENRVAAVLSASPLSSLAVPSTLHASLVARLDRIGAAAREVAQIGSILGREFSYELIRLVADRSEDELQASLARLDGAGLLFCHGTPPHSSYLFKHALVQDAAYGTLLRARRQELHTRVAATLEQHYVDLIERQPELLAHHLTGGGANERAVDQWLKAGQYAATRSAHLEAISHLERGLGALRVLPEGRGRDRREIELELAIGMSSMVAKGGVAAVPSYSRAHALAERSGDARQQFESIYGLWQTHLAAGQIAACRPFSETLLRITESGDDIGLRLQAHHSGWSTSVFAGDLVLARQHARTGRRLYDPEAHANHRHLYGGHDPGACATYTDGWSGWVLGYPDQARSGIADALTLIERIKHPFTSSVALGFATFVDLNLREPKQAVRRIELVDALVSEQRLTPIIEPRILRGGALLVEGLVDEAVPLLRDGIAEWRRLGHNFYLAYGLALLAEALSRSGEATAARRVVMEGLDAVNSAGDHLWDSLLYRADGLALMAENKLAEAQASFEQSLAIASRQQAKSFELRAAISLARLRGEQGRRGEARELLEPIYGWFTEGFDTADLKEAKALLDQLA
jgi:class 3 adenylate cyclase